MLLDKNISDVKIQICSRCIYDARVPQISFDQDGVCNYCHQVEDLASEFGTGTPKGELKLGEILDDIKAAGKGKKYDCIIGVSGGTDSSYLAYLAKTWGLRPLAVHYDNTWNSAIATMNIATVLKALDIDLYTHVVNNKEADDIFRAFFLSGVAEIESSTDLGYAYALRQVAAKFSIRYILEGHSFMTEGVTPLGRNYFDGKYIESIHKKYGARPLETYPLMTFGRFLRSILFQRVKFIRPFWYIDYSKEKAREFLTGNYGWQYYGGHHLENRMTAFLHNVYLPRKFSADMRNNTLAALARNGAMSRAEAWAEYNSPLGDQTELIEFFQKRLNISKQDFERIMNTPPKSWTDYKTYKKRFERLRPLFFIFAKANLVPMSFYLKYCFPVKPPQ